MPARLKYVAALPCETSNHSTVKGALSAMVLVKCYGHLTCVSTLGTALQQRVIDASLTKWRARRKACVRADDGYFEHTL